MDELLDPLLTQAGDRLKHRSRLKDRSADERREPRDRARRLFDHALALVTPMLDRTAALDSRALGYARIELLAAAELLRGDQEQFVAALLTDAVRGLIALQQRADGRVTPNEMMLLVRG